MQMPLTTIVLTITFAVMGATLFPLAIGVKPDLLTRIVGGMIAAGGGFLLGARLDGIVSADTMRVVSVVSWPVFSALVGIAVADRAITAVMSRIEVKLSPAVQKTVIVITALLAGYIGLIGAWALMRI